MKNDGKKNNQNIEKIDLSPNSRTKNGMVYPVLEARVVGKVEKSWEIIGMKGDMILSCWTWSTQKLNALNIFEVYHRYS